MPLSLFFQQSAPAGNPLFQMLPLVLLFGVFYVLIFMPMQKQRKNTKKMLESLQNGNVVVTSGGIVGTIVAIESDDTIVVRVKPDGVKLQVSKGSVSSVVSADLKK